MRINRHDTNGTKPLLGKGELGYDDYTAGGDTGRVYVGTGNENIALAERLESNMMTKAQFNALAEERKANRAGSGFDEWGKSAPVSTSVSKINEGMWTINSALNLFYMGRNSGYGDGVGTSIVAEPIININGCRHKLSYVSANNEQNQISLPTAPTIYPYDTVLTAEQIASGVIKHADASNSGLIVNGKFDTDTSGWVNISPSDISATIVSGSVRLTELTTLKKYIYQPISNLIVGKKYVIEANVSYANTLWYIGIASSSNANNYLALATSTTNKIVQVEFIARYTTEYILLQPFSGIVNSYIDVDNIAVYPADAISRSDLVFLESWHEDISEKNFVYPLGNTQYLGGNTDTLTGITNGNFTGFETYSLFGNWQTPSALIGKGYVWSSLTEAQKKGFIANPENNCYLDGDKTIQVRYRMRVIQGAGDSWDYPFYNMVDGGGSNPPGCTATYSVSSNFYIKPKGKLPSISYDLTVYDVYETGFFANKNYKNVTTGYEIGMATAVNKATTSLDTGVAYEGKCFALPIALISR